ncbi:unnamed protein product, partial [Urochloa humidicola]
PPLRRPPPPPPLEHRHRRHDGGAPRRREHAGGPPRLPPRRAAVAAAVKSARARGCDLRVLSDANAFFVDTVLAHHGLAAFFSGTDTNPASLDAAGRLRIGPYHDFSSPAAGHGCRLPSCPPNMCKGKVMERILREEEEAAAAAAAGRRRRRAVVYLGDGKGDYCPSMKLGEGDYVMPRAGYPVCDLIAAAPPRGSGTASRSSRGCCSGSSTARSPAPPRRRRR